MVFWAEELSELVKKVSDKMEAIEAPKDENGEIIAGTPEVIQFNKYVFALAGCIGRLKEVIGESENSTETA